MWNQIPVYVWAEQPSSRGRDASRGFFRSWPFLADAGCPQSLLTLVYLGVTAYRPNCPRRTAIHLATRSLMWFDSGTRPTVSGPWYPLTTSGTRTGLFMMACPRAENVVPGGFA